MIERISFEDILKIADWWKESGGSSKVEIAALEPTLWKDGDRDICDIVKYLKENGFIVSITTNGSTLSKYSKSLKEAGVDLLRISWHSLDDDVFKDITGGGNQEIVVRGLLKSIELGINVKINRVLLRGYTKDIRDKVGLIDKYKLKIKLLDLYWTPSSNDFYEKYYISPQEVILNELDGFYLEKVDNIEASGRSRVSYRTKNGGVVEYKVKESAEKNHEYCKECKFKDECLEGYGDYFRVFPDSSASLCYLRKDLATYDYSSIFKEETPLRFVLEGRCNFNCGFPGSKTSWCLKQGRGFSFPSRKEVIKIEL